MAPEARKQLEEDITYEATKLAKDKMAGIPDSLEGCTIVRTGIMNNILLLIGCRVRSRWL